METKQVKLHREVIAADIHSMRLIKAMRIQTVRAAVEMKLIATVLARMRLQPLKQLSAVTFAAFCLFHDEVVDVHDAAPREKLAEAETGDGFRLAVVFKNGDAITI